MKVGHAADREVAALRRLAERHGVMPAYEDTTETTRRVAPEVLLAVLQALDVPIRDPSGAEALLRQPPPPTPPVPPVTVTEPTKATSIRLPGEHAGPARWQLRSEDGDVVADGETRDLVLRLDPVPVGFWDLELDLGPVRHTTRVLSTPPRAFRNEALRGSWGMFAPLHAVPRPDGAGHLGDARSLARSMRDDGGRIVAVLPLLAVFLGDEPHEWSPYQPVSRRFWSELYIDPHRLPVGPAPDDLPAAPPDAHGLVEHRSLQRRADALVGHVRARLAASAESRRDLDRFRQERPDVDAYAAFRAAVERHGPRPQRLDGDPERVDHHLVSQWILDRQLGVLRSDLDRAAQALALDLPVGSHPDGFDVHSRPDLYAPAAVGAPPDDFFQAGQNWGFPPLHPVASRADGHRAFVDAVDALARHAGVLRIDHILGLQRLWWVPDGFRADEGAYVRYPLEELLAAVCIVSHRHGTVIVGEDLGTVPPGVTDALHQRGVLGMYEEQFVIGDPGTRRLPRIAAATTAGVNTHDMPTFAGFWDGADLRTQRDLGQIATDEDLDEQLVQRRRSIEAYRRLVAAELGHPVTDDRVSLYTAAVERLARSDADQVIVNIEDLWGETEPQNVPGTHRERPNWRRRMAHPADLAFTYHDARPALDVLRAHRGAPATTGPPTGGSTS